VQPGCSAVVKWRQRGPLVLAAHGLGCAMQVLDALVRTCWPRLASHASVILSALNSAEMRLQLQHNDDCHKRSASSTSSAVREAVSTVSTSLESGGTEEGSSVVGGDKPVSRARPAQGGLGSCSCQVTHATCLRQTQERLRHLMRTHKTAPGPAASGA
jgi:hypothetical protein